MARNILWSVPDNYIRNGKNRLMFLKVERLPDSNFKTFQKNFRWLFFFLKWTGLTIPSHSRKNGIRHLLSIAPKYLFAVALCANAVFLLHTTWSTASYVGYQNVMQTLLYVQPPLLWMAMHSRRRRLRRFVVHLLNSNPPLPEGHLRVSRIMGAFFLVALAYPAVVSAVVTRVRSKEEKSAAMMSDAFFFLDHLCTMVQEHAFMSLATAAYCATTYACATFAGQYRRTFQARPVEPPVLEAQLRQYLKFLRSVERLHDLFSVPLLFLLFQDFTSISYSVLDLVSQRDSAFELLEESLYLLFACGSLSLVTVFAAEVTLGLRRVRLALLDLAESLDSGPRHLADSALSRDLSEATACYVFTFDRGFFMKAVGAIVTQAIVYYQISHS